MIEIKSQKQFDELFPKRIIDKDIYLGCDITVKGRCTLKNATYRASGEFIINCDKLDLRGSAWLQGGVECGIIYLGGEGYVKIDSPKFTMESSIK